jgi:hypothetical protein
MKESGERFVIWTLLLPVGFLLVIASIALYRLANLAGRGKEADGQSISTLVLMAIIPAFIAILALTLIERFYNRVTLVSPAVFAIFSLFSLTLLGVSITSLYKLVNLAGRGEEMPEQSVSILAFMAMITAFITLFPLILLEVFYNRTAFVSPAVFAIFLLFGLALFGVSITSLHKLVSLASCGEEMPGRSVSTLASVAIITTLVAILPFVLVELFYNRIVLISLVVFVILSLFSLALLKVGFLALYRLIGLAGNGNKMPERSRPALLGVASFTIPIGAAGSVVASTLFPYVFVFRIIWPVFSVTFGAMPPKLARGFYRVAKVWFEQFLK